MQEAAGLKVVTDGEFRRLSYWKRFVDAVDGLDVGPARFSFTDDEGDTLPFTAPHVVGHVPRREPVSGDEVDFLRSVTDRTVKVTLAVAVDDAVLVRTAGQVRCLRLPGGVLR